MKIFVQNILLFCLCFLVLSGTNLFAYSADLATQKQADQFVRLIQKKLATLPAERARKLENMIQEKLIQIQNTLIGKTDQASLQKNALYESVRRKLLDDSFVSEEVIFDDGVGAIWTHAPRGFGILYNPIETPTIGALSSGTKNTLLNGSYFSRNEGVEYQNRI